MPKKVRLTIQPSGAVHIEGETLTSCIGSQHANAGHAVVLNDVVELHEEKRGTSDKR